MTLLNDFVSQLPFGKRATGMIGFPLYAHPLEVCSGLKLRKMVFLGGFLC